MQLRIALAGVLLLAAPNAARAETITVGTPGTNGNCAPFGCMRATGGYRFQQVYSHTAFGTPVFVNAVRFFNTDGEGLYDPATYFFRLSTTTRDIGDLSGDPDDNLGEDLSDFAAPSLSGAAGFDLFVEGTPFQYDPALGNLLLDIFVAGEGDPPNYSSSAFFDVVGSNEFTRRATGDDDFVSGEPDSFGFSRGLVTEFSTTPAPQTVPEPASMALLGTGLAGIVGAARRRRRARQEA